MICPYSLFTTVQYPNARLQFQSSWKQARGFRRNRDTSKHVETNFNDAAAGATTLSYAKLWKPLGFTVAVREIKMNLIKYFWDSNNKKHTK